MTYLQRDGVMVFDELNGYLSWARAGLKPQR